MPTMMEVVVEELWTTTVASTPSMTPTMGFCSRSDLEKMWPVSLPPTNRNDVARKSNEQMKKYRQTRMPSSFAATYN